MENNKRKDEETKENTDKKCGEDFTLYGEFIPTFHNWTSFEKLKRKSKELGKKIKE